MERLTKRIDGEAVLQECNGPCKSCNGVSCEDVFQVFDRLAAYEDTGLRPEEITTEPYGCVFYFNRKCNLDGDFCAEGPGCPHEIDAKTAKHLLELAQAEKDGRLVVLPPNDPLTLEQLREMDGEPVWVERPGYGKHWALVQVWAKSTNIIYLMCGNGMVIHPQPEIDGGAKFYRRRPDGNV